MSRRPRCIHGDLLLGLGFVVMTATACLGQDVVQVRVDSQVMLADVRRIGVNVGAAHSWGAEQLAANVVQNAGFEGLLSRQVVFVRDSAPGQFTSTEKQPWLLWPDGFWNGATFDVRSGPSAGSKGVLADYRAKGKDGFPQYVARDALPTLQAGDVVALTQATQPPQPGRWICSGQVQTVADDRPPGSPGQRSLALDGNQARPAVVSYYLDSIGARAGKLLPVNGKWRLVFWSRADQPTRLSVQFRRQGAAAFVDQSIVVAPQWQTTEVEFEANDSGPPLSLELSFSSAGPGRVYLDDVELGPTLAGVGAFRPQVVAALQAMRPGYLRDWQGQQGSTLANSLAAPLARRLTVSGPRADVASFEYSLPDLLALCRRVGALPWIVVPTAYSDDELVELGRWLGEAAPPSMFSEVVVELGNENWNPLSRPAGLPEPAVHGAVVERAFTLIRRGAGDRVALRTAINGQFFNPSAVLAFADSAPHADLVGVAPYFLLSLAAGTAPAQQIDALFPDAAPVFGSLASALSSRRQELAVYEVNLHTTGGNAPATQRDPLTAGGASASGLAHRILQAQAAGARRQCAYTLAGYDMWTDDRSGLVKLWGLVRDLADSARLRPTGLAIAMLNQAIGGDLHATRLPPAVSDVTVAAYGGPGGWSLVVASARPQPARFEVAFPAGTLALPGRLLTLVAASPWDTNEETETVRVSEMVLQPRERTVSFEVPPLGLVVAVPARPRS